MHSEAKTQITDDGKDKDAFRKDELSETFVRNLFKVYKTQAAPAEVDCKHTEMAIAYALDELEGEDKNNIHEHLLSCRACLELVMDTRLAEKESKKSIADYWRIITFTVADFIDDHLTIKKVCSLAAAMAVLVIISSVITRAPQQIGIVMTAYLTESALTARGADEKPKETVLRDGDRLMPGDRYTVKFTSDADAYVYLLFAEDEAVTVFFKGRVNKGATNEITGPKPETFGEKRVLVLPSQEKIDLLEKMNPQQKAGEAEIQKLLSEFPDDSVQSWRFIYDIE
ncbi:zf-HC2 domain-containing protein [Desulfococcaceae bacterium HSG7]|nr:zf-HC2 domain-containing protein [Desulfococcaceae bacterium HSG7]